MLWLFEWLWRVRQIPPHDPEVIVPLDYATDIHRSISSMSLTTLVRAISYANHEFPHALIAYAHTKHCFAGAEKVIALQKAAILDNGPIMPVPPERVVDAGGIINSVTEAWAVRDALYRRNVEPREILLVVGHQHSRSALYIWREVFPTTRISLIYSDGSEWQSDHVFPDQRSGWAWALANIKRQVALRIMGLEWVAKRKHKTD